MVVPRTAKKYSLQPGLLRRLNMLLDETDIQKPSRISFLCEQTGRRKQTVYRWLQNETPGCPDLESFALMCIAFQVDASWMLGLTKSRFDLPLLSGGDMETGADTGTGDPQGAQSFIEDVADEIKQIAPDLERMRMTGDEMEPRIKDGALLFVDTSRREIAGNGIYVLNYHNQRLVRTVDQRVGEGVALLCDNRAYREVMIPAKSVGDKSKLRVIGKVISWLQHVPA